MTEQPEEINVCQDCHERRGRPTVIDYPTNPFLMCHDCNADTDLLAITNPDADSPDLFPTVDPGSVWADFTDSEGQTIASIRVTRNTDGTTTVHTIEHAEG